MAEARDGSLQRTMRNHFELFGLEPAFKLDAERLERAYREIQASIHPDRYAHSGDADRRASMQWTARVNEAYRTLKNPVQRGKYLLELNGVDVAFETNTAMPAEFLVRQLELRESLEEARTSRDPAKLSHLRAGLREDERSLEGLLEEALDAKKDHAQAAELVRKLMFLERLDAEIDAAFETMDE